MEPLPKSYGANGGKPHKWRRRRLTFKFLECAECGRGQRRHVLFDTNDLGGVWNCSRRHARVIAWTRDEKWRRDTLTIMKQIYMPVFLSQMRSADVLLRSYGRR